MADHEQALAWIHSLFRFGMKPGLDRTRELLRRLGNPHRAGFGIVHVTGTNGKGSTCAMVAAGLQAAGKQTGLYTSPFLERWTERIQVNRREIGMAEVVALVNEVRPHVEAMVAEGHEQPTEFEVTTAIAFLYYARVGVDWLVLEVGLGGRYDATNVVEHPAVTCITNISLDHVTVLGNTPGIIAHDKAGILKPGVPNVTAEQDPDTLAVIQSAASACGAPLHRVTCPPVPVYRGLDGQTFDLPGLPGLHTVLVGDHQMANAACAARILQLCGVPETALRRGLASATWPARFEVLTQGPVPVILDGAHNEAGADALALTVQELLRGRPLTLVLGVLADKNVDQVVTALMPLASHIICTTPENGKRALPAAQLATRVTDQSVPVPVETVPDLIAAAERGLAATAPEGILLITGSLYLVGPVRAHLRRFGYCPDQLD